MIEIYRHVAELIRYNRCEDARTFCKDLARSEPDNPALLRLAVAVARRCTDIAGTSLHDDQVAALLISGSIAKDTGDVPVAIGFFREAQVLSPDNPEPAFLLCTALLDAGQAEASSLLPVLMQRFPGSAPGWGMIGQSLARANRNEAALVAFTRACRIAPSAELFGSCGRALLKLERTTEALAALADARALAPENFEAALAFGLCLKKAGQTDAAARALRDATRIHPSAAPAWFALGLLEQDRFEFRAAIAAYDQAIASEPEMAEAAVNLGICWQELGDLDAAKSAYGGAMRIRPDTFGRIAQALTLSPKGELWLDLDALRTALT